MYHYICKNYIYTWEDAREDEEDEEDEEVKGASRLKAERNLATRAPKPSSSCLRSFTCLVCVYVRVGGEAESFERGMDWAV